MLNNNNVPFIVCFIFVPVAPQTPRIEYNGSQVLPGHNLTALHGIVAVIKCVSHYGNPPPVLKWFLGKFFFYQPLENIFKRKVSLKAFVLVLQTTINIINCICCSIK